MIQITDAILESKSRSHILKSVLWLVTRICLTACNENVSFIFKEGVHIWHNDCYGTLCR